MLVTELLIRRISPSRALAFETLEAVYKGAFATDTLLALSTGVNSRDASLASQIVFGCLRYQGQLDWLIGHYSGRPVSTLDLPVVLALRAGIFQLRYLDRIPAHAAVHESVEFVKTARRAASGMVNAVLRKVNRDPAPWPDKATELSCPAWLLERWTAHFGAEAAEAIARAALQEPGRYIRVPPGSPLPPNLHLEETDVQGCFRIPQGEGILPAGIRLHDNGSQSLIPLLDLQPGQRYLDVCSAPGNKTVQAAETPLAICVAGDISHKRLKEVPPTVERVVFDATSPLPFACTFDRIFVDAPCSGTGTLSRNPEIKWRVQAEDFPRFAERQRAILREAARLLAPGGKLLYATCSLEPEENEEVLDSVLRNAGGRTIAGQVWRLPGREEGDGFYGALLV
jgi:16S rRNA (cytosine967-C5)-methyltransferase